jgi:hypothetical protein
MQPGRFGTVTIEVRASRQYEVTFADWRLEGLPIPSKRQR